MTTGQRWVVSAVAALLAVGLSWHYVEYRVEDANAKHVPEGLILSLGEGHRAPTPGAQPEPPPGFQVVTQQGIYARRDHSAGNAAVGGLVLPLLLMAVSAYLVLGKKS